MRVLHVIKTTSLDSDGRLLKWLKFLKTSNIESDVCIVQDNNSNSCFLAHNAQIISVSLKTRRFFKKHAGYLLKIPEYTFHFALFFSRNRNKYNFLVFHDMQQYLNILVTRMLFRNWKGKVIWDMHELPHPIFFKHWIFRAFMNKVLRSVDLLVYTNSERRKLTLEKFCYEEHLSFILNNYPDKEFNFSQHQKLPFEVNSWLDGEKYILWLGGGSEARNFGNFLDVYNSEFKAMFKLIILGRVESDFAHICNKLVLENRVKISFVKQSELINYIDNSFFSVVLYKDNTMNNLYCEPNRLYQLLNRGIPVIVGNNPTLADVLEGRNFGIVLSDDGSQREVLNDAFKKMIENREIFYETLKFNNEKQMLNIDDQFKSIIDSLKKL